MGCVTFRGQVSLWLSVRGSISLPFASVWKVVPDLMPVWYLPPQHQITSMQMPNLSTLYFQLGLGLHAVHAWALRFQHSPPDSKPEVPPAWPQPVSTQ